MDFPAEKHRVVLVGPAIVWRRRGRRQGRTSGVIESFTLLQERPGPAENDVIERRNEPSLNVEASTSGGGRGRSSWFLPASQLENHLKKDKIIQVNCATGSDGKLSTDPG